MSSNKDLISIIVPIFNSEKYLAECIDSILSQTYRNIEILLINDGSSDSSKSICQNYTNEDERIKYFYQINQGVSAARNSGINHANGKYIMFIDSDDNVAEDMVEEMHRKAVECDSQLVIGGMISSIGEIGKDYDFQNQVFSGKKEIAIMFADNYLKFVASSPCCKLYCKDAINGIKFREGMALGEDLLFNVSVFSSVNKVALVNKSLYHYRLENGSSLTNTYKDGYYEDMKYLYEEAMGFIRKTEDESQSVIDKSNIGYKFYNFAVAFIVRQIERKDSKDSCKRYIEKICNDFKFMEAVNLIDEASFIDKLMIGLLKRKQVGLIYSAAVFRSKVRRL